MRPKLYMPLDFTMSEGVEVVFNDCIIYEYNKDTGTVNSFAKHIKSSQVYDGWDIFTEDPMALLDKIESYETGELILS